MVRAGNAQIRNCIAAAGRRWSFPWPQALRSSRLLAQPGTARGAMLFPKLPDLRPFHVAHAGMRCANVRGVACPRPLLARADLALDNSYSEAPWDDRARLVFAHTSGVSLAARCPRVTVHPRKQRRPTRIVRLCFSFGNF
jgi:hypothetical protein